MTDTVTFKTYGPGPVYTGVSIWLPLLMYEAAVRGENSINGKTFVDCSLQGPSVIVPISGCQFDACDMGASDNDIRNLLLQPVGPTKITGAIAFRDCVFQRCAFVGIGYTGAAEFLDQMRAIDGVPAFGAGA
jgi:hypothetical protein